jgi:hypothetical protein
VLGLGDFEPFAGVKRTVILLQAVGPLHVTVEETEHLAAVCYTEIDLADGRSLGGLF